MITSRGETPLNGSDVEDEVLRLIERYGVERTKKALRRLTNRKPRIKLTDDWKALDAFLKSDALRWLGGGDPFEERSDYSIAKWFAENHPDTNVEFDSTLRRIKRRLSKSRRYYVLVEAFWLSEAGYSYQTHLKALRELCRTSRSNASWRAALQTAESTLSDYEARFGAPPATMTMRQIGLAVAGAILAEFAQPKSNILQGLVSGQTKPNAARK